VVQEVVTEVRRFIESARRCSVGRPHIATIRHLQFLARSIVLQDRQKGKAEHLDWRKKKDVASLLADEFSFSKNPTGNEYEKGASRTIRRALDRSKSELKTRLNWSGECIVFTGGESWIVLFLRGFNPMFSYDYRYTRLPDNVAFSLAPPVNWYVVYHWEYMEPTVNLDNPSEIGIRRRIDETVECKPFFLKLPGINVP